MAVAALVVAAAACGAAWAGQTQPSDGGGVKGTMLEFVTAGGPVGYVIIALSAAGLALVIDAAVHVKDEKLLPHSLVDEVKRLAAVGRFSEMMNVCAGSGSLAGRVLHAGLAQGELGLDAVREAIQEHGTRRITRLQQRVGYIGFIASVAPMLGLLGTVVGMIGSFKVLGDAKGAARPDELAIGISTALVTTCMGLIVAVPLMFFHSYFRDRVTRISQELSGICERVLRIMTTVVESRAAAPRQRPAVRAGGSAPAARPGAEQPSAAAGADGEIDSALGMGDG